MFFSSVPYKIIPVSILSFTAKKKINKRRKERQEKEERERGREGGSLCSFLLVLILNPEMKPHNSDPKNQLSRKQISL